MIDDQKWQEGKRVISPEKEDFERFQSSVVCFHFIRLYTSQCNAMLNRLVKHRFPKPAPFEEFQINRAVKNIFQPKKGE